MTHAERPIQFVRRVGQGGREFRCLQCESAEGNEEVGDDADGADRFFDRPEMRWSRRVEHSRPVRIIQPRIVGDRNGPTQPAKEQVLWRVGVDGEMRR